MKAIQTKYKGYKFRSRLEARWAVYFDTLKIKWEYEPEGFHFNDGTNYLPDFWLPQVNMWVEVKAKELNEKEWNKANNLAFESNKPVLMLIGTPEITSYWAMEYTNKNPSFFHLVEYVLTNYHNYPTEEGRFYSNPGESKKDFIYYFPDIKEASDKAKEARFEFEDDLNKEGDTIERWF